MRDMYDEFVKHDRQNSQWLRSRERCTCCHEIIQGEPWYDEYSDPYCDDCWMVIHDDW